VSAFWLPRALLLLGNADFPTASFASALRGLRARVQAFVAHVKGAH
jgi:hypothetical protein